MSTGIQWAHSVSMWPLRPAEPRGQVIAPETKLWASALPHAFGSVSLGLAGTLRGWDMGLSIGSSLRLA